MLLKHSSDDELPVINLTPMLDVVFNLMVFFMVGTTFSEPDHAIEVNVPQVSAAAPLVAPPSRRVIYITRTGAVWLDNQETTLDHVAGELARACREYPELGVTVKGDAESQLQIVADTLAVVAKAGVRDTSISVRLAEGNAVRR
jgi:biopolymer transport protein ExbD